jgi:hypothetical protein
VRRLLAAAALLLTAGCGGDGASTSAIPLPPAACAARPAGAVPLATAPRDEPTEREAVCLARLYSAVIGDAGWEVADTAWAAEASVRLWQRRSLLSAGASCPRCAPGGMPLAWVRSHRPEWILRAADGAEVRTGDGGVLLDFGDPDYQAEWAARVVPELVEGRWSGAAMVDAGNDPDWSETPVDPRTERPMTPSARSRYLAEALALVHAELRLNAMTLLAFNGPASIPVAEQLGGADAVSPGAGFAGRRGDRWLELFDYFRLALDRGVAAVTWDRARLPERERAWAVASWLLVAAPGSAYGVAGAAGAGDPLLARLRPGTLEDAPPPVQQGPAWVRELADATVAVNPGTEPAPVDLGEAGGIELAPGEAVVAVGAEVVAGG